MFVLSVACWAVLGLNAARADDDGMQGGEIEGVEDLDIDVFMTPTPVAPPGSSIELKLQADNEDGTTEAELELEERGLPAGTFSVSVTLKSNGSTVQMGTFTIANGQNEAEIKFVTDNENENEGEDEDENENEAPFPANLDPFDIATVSVANSNGMVLFTADLTKASATAQSMNLTANVQVTPGPSAPNATGSAALRAFISGGKPKGSVQLTAQHLPAKTHLKVLINGATAKAKKADTNSMGKISLRVAPKGKTGNVAPGVSLFEVHSLRLTDKSGNLMLSANF